MSRAMALNQYGVPINRRKKIPCRCNKCGSRKTLAKYPEEYRYGEKKCHGITCDGLMRVDKYRLQAQYDPEKYKKDSGIIPCRCSGHPRVHPKGKVNYDTGFCCTHVSNDVWRKFEKHMTEELNY